jgi:hypothetical protein
MFNEYWEFTSYPRGYKVEVQPTSASILASDPNKLPILLQNTLGSGKVIYSIPFVEAEFVRLSNQPALRDRWIHFYKGLLSL